MTIPMFLPISPPSSRSSSQTPASRKPATYNPNERSITPISPSAESSSPTQRFKPALTLNPSATPCAVSIAPTAIFPVSPAPTPSSGCSSLQSIFSPCSDSEDDDDDEEDDDEDNYDGQGSPIKSPKPRGHYRRLWASRDPPSMPPSDPPPALPRPRTPSPTFGWRTNPTPNHDKEPQFVFSSGPNTPAFAPRRPSRLSTYSMHPPAAPEAPPTGVFPPPSPWGDGILSYVNSPTIPVPSDPLLQNLQTLLAEQLQNLGGIFTAPPPPELAIARAERDRLLVKTQKAYFRRTPQEAVAELHVELQENEERVKRLEREFVRGFMVALDGFVDGVRNGCRGFMGEDEPEIIELDVPEEGHIDEQEDEEEEEEEVYEDAMEWPEEEATSQVFQTTFTPALNAERRFTWNPPNFEDEEDEEGEYYVDPTVDPSFSPLPPLSPSNSSCASSPLIDVDYAYQGQCDWSSFLPPSPALSNSSQRMMRGKGAGDQWEKKWGENVVIVQGVEMTMI